MSDILIDDALKIEIKRVANIVTVIGEYVTLIQEGGLYKGLCPFHDEDTPSFVVYPSGYNGNDNSTFYCFGCHAGNKEETNISNDVIGFIMAIEEVDFITACQMLCDKFNIHYEKRVKDPEIARLKQEVTNKNLMYYNNLIGNNLVLDYLSSRGVNYDSITKFRLGLTTQKEFPEWKSNRLVFAITDINYDPCKASTIGMGYRVLQGQVESSDGIEYFPNSDIKSKYRNDAESKIFVKRKSLYGLTHAIKAIRKDKFAILVEGYLDVILMHQSGFENTVSPMGTSLTDDQIEILKRYTEQLIFFMDSDKRGLEAMKKTLPRLLEKGFNILVVECPQGEDPADLCNKLGQNKDMLTSYIKNHSYPALQWSMSSVMDEYEAKVHKAKVDALESVLPILDKVSHRSSKIAYTSSISNKLGLDASLFNVNSESVVPKSSGSVVNIPKLSPEELRKKGERFVG